MAKGFAAGGTGFRPNNVGAHPTATFFALRIDTLNSGARHQGHKTLPPVAACSTTGSEPPKQPGNV